MMMARIPDFLLITHTCNVTQQSEKILHASILDQVISLSQSLFPSTHSLSHATIRAHARRITRLPDGSNRPVKIGTTSSHENIRHTSNICAIPQWTRTPLSAAGAQTKSRWQPSLPRHHRQPIPRANTATGAVSQTNETGYTATL